MMLKFRNAALVLYVVLLISWMTHVVGSGVFTIGILIVTAMLVYFLHSRFSSASRAASQQATSSRSASLTEASPTGYGFVFVYRQGGGLMIGPLLHVLVDEASQVALKKAQFARFTVPAGDHRLVARVAGENATGQNLPAETTFTMVSGVNLFDAVSTSMSLSRYAAVLTRDANPSSTPARLDRLTQVAG